MALSPSLTFRPQAGTSITLLGHFQNDDSGSTQQFLPHVGTRFRSASGFVDSGLFVGEPGFDRYDTDVKSGSLFVDHKFNDTFAVHHNMRYSDIFNVYDTYYPGFFAGPEAVGDDDFPFLDPAQRTIRRIKAIGDTSTQLLNTDTNLEAKLQTGPASHRLLGGLDYAKFRSSSTYGQAVSQTPFDLYNPVYGQPDNLGIPIYDADGLIDSYRLVGAVPLTDFGKQDITQTGFTCRTRSSWPTGLPCSGCAATGCIRTAARSSSTTKPIRRTTASTQTINATRQPPIAQA